MAGAVAVRLDNIRSKGGIRGREVAQLLRTTPQTVSRWHTGRAEPQPEALQRLLALEWLVTQLSGVYGPAEARIWLYAPHPLLRGARPADKIIADESDEVLTLIAQLNDGAFI